MVADGSASADELTLKAHLAGIAFQAGVEEGRWSVLHFAFPELIVQVRGCDFSGEVTAEMTFRLLCDGFPITAPFLEAWDPAAGKRPAPLTGQEAPPGLVDAFKLWHRDGTNDVYGGIYRAWQRHAAVHNNWAQKRPDEAWRRDRNLTFIMEKLYGLVAEQAAWLALRAAA